MRICINLTLEALTRKHAQNTHFFGYLVFWYHIPSPIGCLGLEIRFYISLYAFMCII